MVSVNKKLWSFNFGCLIVVLCFWLAKFGNEIPVPEFLFAHPVIVHDYYSGVVTSILASIFTILLVIIMRKVFNVCSSEHTFWLAIPSIMLSLLALWTGFEIYAFFITALLVSLFMISIISYYFRASKRKV